MHQLCELYPTSSLVVNRVGTSCLGCWKANHSIFCLDWFLYHGVIAAIKLLHLILVFLPLRVVNRKELHEEVSGVGELWHRLPNVLEVFNGLFGVTLVHNMTIGHQDEPIEEEKGLGAWRVNRANNCLSFIAGQVVKQLANTSSLKRVKA